MNARRLAIAILLLLLLPLAACGNKGDLVRPPPDDIGIEAVPGDDDSDSDAPLPVDDAGDDGTAPSVDMLPPPDIDDIEDDGGEDDSGNDDTDGGGG